MREGDVFINLKDPGERRTVWTSDACPGDPGQSAGWIRQHFHPEKSRLEASEKYLLRIHLLGKHLWKLSIGDEKNAITPCKKPLEKCNLHRRISIKSSA